MRAGRSLRKPIVMILFATLVVLGAMQCGDGTKKFKPLIESLICAPDGIEHGTPAIFEWTGGDPDGQVVGYIYGLDDNPQDTWTTASACTLTGISIGSHVFFVRAEDNDGMRSDLVSCSFKVAERGEECSVSPSSLDFGAVAVGQSADLVFKITNNGTGILSGVAGASCDNYSVLGGAYSLAPSQSSYFTVRFEPESCGPDTCSIDTGVGCPDVICLGEGGGSDCQLSAGSLDFGLVNLGSSADRTFTLTNTGCTALNGAIGESCDHYSVVSGGGTYSLGSGQILSVTVRFTPESAGVHTCTLETGLTGTSCSAVACTGQGRELSTACVVSPTSLDFGTVDVGQSADLVFTIENSGETSLSGTIGEPCDHYSIVSGAGAYSLGAGESRAVTVRFEPASCGGHACTIETGIETCSDVSCTGEGGGTGCDLSAGSLDFGSVDLGSSADRTFILTNTGCLTLAGVISESCGDYTILSGVGAYSLSAGQTRSVTVRFSPASEGVKVCTVETGLAGTQCAAVTCNGQGVDNPTGCGVLPASLNFDPVEIGSSSDLDFTITNNGATTLSGAVGESCDHYTLVSGGGSYSLGAGQSFTVTVRFEPTSCGTHTCTIETGDGACVDVGCAGLSWKEGCDVSADTLDFGAVTIGTTEDESFDLINSGCTTLTGTISESCGEYSIVSGGGSYSLEAGGSRTVTVRFSPDACGPRACTIETGHDICSDIVCVGEGDRVVCDVSPLNYGFGVVDVGSYEDATFTITNSGCATISGMVSEPCADFSIVSGESYSIGPDQSHIVTVRFSPVSEGPRSCAIETDVEECPHFICSGTGSVTACDVSPTFLNFPLVDVGSSYDTTFTVLNDGTNTLSGEISESCDEFSVISGGGPFSLARKESLVVKVRFSPTTCGAKTCTIETGSEICSDVSCSGATGGTECEVSPDILAFGLIDIGASLDKTFTIKNKGCGSIAGTISESCADYSIVSGGGAYSLAPEESLTVTVRFSPTSCGLKTCAVETGLGLCSDVSCSGEGGQAGCVIVPGTLDFGAVSVGTSADTTFTVRNIGCLPIAGVISQVCQNYSLVSGGGAYSLAAGESLTVTVRFSPTSCDTKTCTIDMGNQDCPGVFCSGGGAVTACDVSPSSLAFDMVELGSRLDLYFTITNNGCGTVEGLVSELCGDYLVIFGNGFYSLDPGESRIVTVRYSPTLCGVSECTIGLGTGDCADVPCSGQGVLTECSVSPDVLNFGSVDIGSSLNRAFTIRNDGCEVLDGVVTEFCDDYSIYSGGGAYSLGAGQSRVVTVQFAPTVCGTRPCTIETGNGACSVVSCTGEGDLVDCSVNPVSLDLGPVNLGASADTTFTITNDGCNTLAGTVSETCDDYSIISGGGAYSLAAGDSVTVTVRFTPTVCGTRLCTIDTGNGACSNVSFSGEGDLVDCSVSPVSLDFGPVNLGSSADTTFTIRNDGCNTLAGTVSETCEDYSIISGGGAYSLSAGDSVMVTVRFAPTVCGTRLCTIDTGNGACSNVSFSGEGDLVDCSVSPVSLDFGPVNLGSSADTTFTIRNDGCNTLAGTVSETCEDYSIISGGGAYSLSAGDSVMVTVRFAPTVCGTRLCTIDTGNGACSDVSCTGEGDLIACSVSPVSLDFGQVDLASSTDTTFVIRNDGCNTLAGTVSETCDDYSIISGGGAYALAAGDSVTVTVRFTPATCGTLPCTIETGNGACSDVSCTGVGDLIACSVSPVSLDFGPIDLGSFADTTFTIRNDGCNTLAGTVGETCDDYSIIVGGGAYSLAAGDSVTVTVRFAPTVCGTRLCTIDTGNGACSNVSFSGEGDLIDCSVSPVSLDFGPIDLGSFADTTFVIRNDGCNALAGTVSETCDDYSIIAGGGAYSLAAGDSVTVTVRFAPTICGTRLCTIETGNGACSDVSCTGVGDLIDCSVSPVSLDFGTVDFGSFADTTFVIRNDGCNALVGTVSETCDDYSIIAGVGAYSIAAGDSLTVTVRFAPAACGTLPCTIETGNGACSNVSCTGVGEDYGCSVAPDSISFGDVAVGVSADSTFTITNTGACGTVIGTISESCDDFEIISGGGPFLLGPGAPPLTVTIRFAPLSAGAKSCTISLGSTHCSDFACDGTGTSSP